MWGGVHVKVMGRHKGDYGGVTVVTKCDSTQEGVT